MKLGKVRIEGVNLVNTKASTVWLYRAYTCPEKVRTTLHPFSKSNNGTEFF